MKVLVLNCGSSSIKYQLINMGKGADVLAKGLVERIGSDHAELTHQVPGKDKIKAVKVVADHQVGINWVLEHLTSPQCGVIKNVEEIAAVGHRVAHGGEQFKTSVLVSPQVLIDLEKITPLAPLHNPANLKGITSMQALLPKVPQVAVFDTSFHQTMPAYSYMYAIPYEYYEDYKIRRYGFHGTSHKFVAQKAADLIGVDIKKVNIISCHLGNGASIAAIQQGKSVDTSMGFTPVEGLVMGTRAGDLDLGAALLIMEKGNLSIQQANDVFNKKSGLQGISGVSSDMRDLETAASQGNKRAQLALQMFEYRVKKYIGAYAAVMGGVDIILFTGGIGEKACKFSQEIFESFCLLGLEFYSKAKYVVRGKDQILTQPNSKVKAVVVTTDEELVIATDTFNIVTK
ncbi:MAG: acetate kinase [Bacteroidales bacterium]